MFYIYKDNNVLGSTPNKKLIKGIAVSMGVTDYEIGTTDFEDYHPNNDKYLFENGQIKLNPDYGQIKKKIRIAEIRGFENETALLKLGGLFNEGIITVAEYNAEIDRMRESEYQTYTDKIGLMVLRGEATKEEWLQAMDTIRAKYPHKE